MRIQNTIASAFLICLAGCAETIPPPPDFNSSGYQEQAAKERLPALREVAKSGKNITRTFHIIFEIHTGYHMYPIEGAEIGRNNLSISVTPDFLDETIRKQFHRESPFSGKTIICECTGVEWQYYSQKRFLVRAAKLKAI